MVTKTQHIEILKVELESLRKLYEKAIYHIVRLEKEKILLEKKIILLKGGLNKN
jgi:hypothetical protein